MFGYFVSVGNQFRWYFCNGSILRSTPPEVFLAKRVMKIRSKFTGQHLYQSVISIKLQSNFVQVALQYECSPVNLLAAHFQNTFSQESLWTAALQLTSDGFCSPYRHDRSSTGGDILLYIIDWFYQKIPLATPPPPHTKSNPIRNLTLTLPLAPHGGLFSGGIFSWRQERF